MSVTQSAVGVSTCPVYAWCRETGVHELHNSVAVSLAEPGRTPHPRRYIEAWLMAEDGRHGQDGIRPLIGFGEQDLTPAGLRAQIAEIRAILPQLEALANAAEQTSMAKAPARAQWAGAFCCPTSYGHDTPVTVRSQPMRPEHPARETRPHASTTAPDPPRQVHRRRVRPDRVDRPRQHVDQQGMRPHPTVVRPRHRPLDTILRPGLRGRAGRPAVHGSVRGLTGRSTTTKAPALQSGGLLAALRRPA